MLRQGSKIATVADSSSNVFLTLNNQCRSSETDSDGNTIGTIYWEGIRNGDAIRRAGIIDIVERMNELKWNWARYMARRRDLRWTKKNRPVCVVQEDHQ